MIHHVIGKKDIFKNIRTRLKAKKNDSKIRIHFLDLKDEEIREMFTFDAISKILLQMNVKINDYVRIILKYPETVFLCAFLFVLYLFMEFIFFYMQYQRDHIKISKMVKTMEEDQVRMKKIWEMKINEEEWKSESLFNQGFYNLQNRMKEYEKKIRIQDTSSQRLRKEILAQNDHIIHLRKNLSIQKGRITKLQGVMNQYLLNDEESSPSDS